MVLVIQGAGLEFNPRTPVKKLGVMASACHRSDGKAEAGRSLGLSSKLAQAGQ